MTRTSSVKAVLHFVGHVTTLLDTIHVIPKQDLKYALMVSPPWLTTHTVVDSYLMPLKNSTYWDTLTVQIDKYNVYTLRRFICPTLRCTKRTRTLIYKLWIFFFFTFYIHLFVTRINYISNKWEKWINICMFTFKLSTRIFF